MHFITNIPSCGTASRLVHNILNSNYCFAVLLVLFPCMFIDTECSNSGMIVVAASTGVGMLVVGVIIGLIIGIVCMRRRRQSAKNGKPLS